MDGTSIQTTANLAGRRPRSVQKNITLMQVNWQMFGDDLRTERTKRGLTYRQFAQHTGVNFSTLARLEGLDAHAAAVELRLAALRRERAA